MRFRFSPLLAVSRGIRCSCAPGVPCKSEDICGDPLTASIPGGDSDAAMLVRVGFAVILVPVNVPVAGLFWHASGMLGVAYTR